MVDNGEDNKRWYDVLNDSLKNDHEIAFKFDLYQSSKPKGFDYDLLNEKKKSRLNNVAHWKKENTEGAIRVLYFEDEFGALDGEAKTKYKIGDELYFIRAVIRSILINPDVSEFFFVDHSKSELAARNLIEYEDFRFVGCNYLFFLVDIFSRISGSDKTNSNGRTAIGENVAKYLKGKFNYLPGGRFAALSKEYSSYVEQNLGFIKVGKPTKANNDEQSVSLKKLREFLILEKPEKLACFSSKRDSVYKTLAKEFSDGVHNPEASDKQEIASHDIKDCLASFRIVSGWVHETCNSILDENLIKVFGQEFPSLDDLTTPLRKHYVNDNVVQLINQFVVSKCLAKLHRNEVHIAGYWIGIGLDLTEQEINKLVRYSYHVSNTLYVSINGFMLACRRFVKLSNGNENKPQVQIVQKDNQCEIRVRVSFPANKAQGKGGLMELMEIIDELRMDKLHKRVYGSTVEFLQLLKCSGIQLECNLFNKGNNINIDAIFNLGMLP